MKLLTTSLLALIAGSAAFVPSPKAFVASNVGNGEIRHGVLCGSKHPKDLN